MKALLLLLLTFAHADDPRIVLRTSVGDMVLAPAGNFSLLQKMVSAGAFEKAQVGEVDPSRFVKVILVQPTQLDISPEASTKAKQTDVWMRKDGTLLFIVAETTGLDATPVARVVRGADVLEAIRNLPLDARREPQRRIEITNALFATTDAQIESLGLRGFSATLDRRRYKSFTSPTYLASAVLLLLLGFLVFYIGRYRLKNALASIGLTLVLVGSFLLFSGSVSYPNMFPGQTLLTFFGMLATFKLMSQFESYE